MDVICAHAKHKRTYIHSTVTIKEACSDEAYLISIYSYSFALISDTPSLRVPIVRHDDADHSMVLAPQRYTCPVLLGTLSLVQFILRL